MYLVTKVLLNLYRFCSILATTQYFRLLKSAIMDQFVTFLKRVYNTFLLSNQRPQRETCVFWQLAVALEISHSYELGKNHIKVGTPLSAIMYVIVF